LLGKQVADALPIANLTAMDAPENIEALHAIGLPVGQHDLHASHFPRGFDLV
jgi:hypothetical protein